METMYLMDIASLVMIAVIVVVLNLRQKPLTSKDCLEIIKSTPESLWTEEERFVKVPVASVRNIPVRLSDSGRSAVHRSHHGHVVRSRVVSIKDNTARLRRGKKFFERPLAPVSNT